MENVFSQEVEFTSKVYTTEGWTSPSVQRTATFKELDATDETQHRLHFKISAMMIAKIKEVKEENGEDISDSAGKIFGRLDADEMYDITVRFIKTMLILVDKVPDGAAQQYPIFTATDKTEFLQDSGALLRFALKVVPEKILPFFPKLLTSSST